jgi:hypothetical protein
MARKSKEDAEINITQTKVTSKSKSTSTSKKTKKPRTVERAKKKIKKRQDFIDANDHIIEQLEHSPNAEQEHLREYIYIYKSLKKLVRKSKMQALKSGQSRDYYSYCTLVSQQREVIADIRTIADLSGQVQMLIEQALQPMASQLGQVIVNSFYQQRKLITETVKEKEVQFALKKLDEITGDTSKALQMYYEQAAMRINEILVGVPEETKPKKKRK